MNKIRNIAWIADIFVYGIFSQRKEHRYALKIMIAIERQLGISIAEESKLKAARGYSVSKSIYLDAFTLLYGRRLNKEERKRLVYYFTAAALYDAFFDETRLSDDDIRKMSFDTENYTPQTDAETAWIFLHQYLKKNIQDTAAYGVCCEEIYKAQKLSLQQFHSELSNETLEKLTHDKGGYSVLICHFYVQQTFTNIELDCWYLIGSCIQLCNDLYDIYKDTQDDLHTLATRAKTYNEALNFFNKQVGALQQKIVMLNKSNAVKQRFSFLMATVYAFGYIALDNLKRIQGKHPSLPVFSSLNREELIIDMELWKNRWKCLQYIYSHGKINAQHANRFNR